MYCLRNLYWSFTNQTTLNLTKNYTQFVLSRTLCDLNNSVTKYEYTPISRASKILEKHFAGGTTCWEKVQRELIDSAFDPERCKSIIFNCCIQLQAYDHGLDFYKYLLKKNENLKTQELVPVLEILSKCNTIELESDTVRDLYNKFRPLLETHTVLQKPAFEVFSKFKCYWKDLVELSPKLHSVTILDTLISSAFDFDEKYLGFQMLSTESEFFSNEVLISFFTMCIRNAKKGTFDVSDLDFLISFANENFVRFSNINLMVYFKKLIEILNSQERKNVWSVSKSVVNSSSVCSNCCNQLNKMSLHNEVCKELKEAMERYMFSGENILIKSSKKEFMSFKAFLKEVAPYNFVVDGTNLYYSSEFEGVSLPKLIHILKKKKKNLLIIARKHLKKHRTISLFQSESNVFWTENESDDDAFVIYAALCGGPNTYFFSKDFFRGYHTYFVHKPKLRKSFLSWKESHLYTTQFNKIVPPMKHALLPQKTVNQVNGTQIWHFPEIPYITDDFSLDSSKWVCLERHPIQSNDSNNVSNNSEKKIQPLELREDQKSFRNKNNKNNNTSSTYGELDKLKILEGLQSLLRNSKFKA